MRIGFDIDDTLINLREHAFTIYNDKLGMNVPHEDFHKLERVEIHEIFGMTDEQGKEMWNSSLEEIYYTSCPAYPNAIEMLSELSTNGHDIFYITARPKEHGERTKNWMRLQGFPVHDQHFFYGMADHQKGKFITELNLDYYFDDKPEVLNALKEVNGTKLIVRDQTYNRHLTFPRIVDWTDIHKFLEDVKQSKM